jgi:hypothetical protein
MTSVTTEKNKLRKNEDLKAQDRLGLQLKSKADQLLIERNDLEKELVILALQVSDSFFWH